MREMKDSGIEWIGEIPKDKKLRRTKYDLSFIKGKIPTNINNEKIGTPYIGASNLDCNEEYDVFTTDCDLPSSEYNDTLILWDGARAGLVGTGHKGFISSTIMKVSPINDKIDKEFFYWYCKGFEWYFYMKVNGTTIPHMNRDYIYDIGLIEFNKEKQHLIAEYLDKKCSKIDEIIAKQQTVIEKLKEYKLSIITEAVTKGLNPNVTMKDSGVEWIGEIPEEYKLIKSKYLVSISNGSDPVLEGEIPVYGSGAKSFKTCGEYKEGPAVLIGRKGATLHIPHYIKGKYWNVDTAFNVNVIDNKSLNLLYYYYLSICFDYKKYISQTTLPSMTQTDYKNIILPIPKLEEQKQITDYLDSKCEKINFTINKKQKLIDKLTEYKKSLIYEVVTGKKEV